MNEDDERLLEHAWRHFALHAQQRTTVFNFYTASAGLALTGMFYVLATAAAPKVFGVAAGLGAALLSFVFWKLDERVTQMIKVGEQILVALEQSLPDPRHRIFERVEGQSVNSNLFRGVWSYGRSFRTMFLVVGIIGLVGAVICYRSTLLAPVERTTTAPTGRVFGVKLDSGNGLPANVAMPQNVLNGADVGNGAKLATAERRSDGCASVKRAAPAVKKNCCKGSR